MKMTASTGILACMTGALWAKRGERDISRGAVSCFALVSRYVRISRSPRLAHKALVMQATGILAFKIGPVHMYQFLFENE